MKTTPQTSNHSNQVNNREKARLLSFLRDNKTNHELNTHLYQRGNQATTDNGWAKYIDIIQDKLYQQYIEIPEERLRNVSHIYDNLKSYDTIFDLWPGWGKTTKYIDRWQLYRPMDISAYIIDYIKKINDLKIEWTLGDIFNTNIFKESQGKKAYILGKVIPNLSDEEIIQLIQSLQPTKDGRSTLVISYFPPFEETEDNVHRLKAIYGDHDKTNPYYSQETYEKTRKFVIGLPISLGFSAENIEHIVSYDTEKHAIITKIKIKKDINITIDREQFSRKKWDEIPLITSRRMSDNHLEKILKESGRERKQHKSDQNIAVDIFEKIDPNKRVKKIKNTIIAWLTATMLISGIAYNNHSQKQETQAMKMELREKIKDLNISLWIPDNMWGQWLNWVEYVEPFVTQYAKSLQEIIRTRYGTLYSQEEYIEIRLLEYLSEQSFWNNRNRDFHKQTEEKIDFIDNVFIPENKLLLKKLGVTNIPYKRLHEHHDIISSMENYKGQQYWVTNISNIWQALKNNRDYSKYIIKNIQEWTGQSGIINVNMHIDFIWKYITQDGKEYQIALYAPEGKFKRSILLAYSEDEYKEDAWFIYTTEAGKIVAKDYENLLKKLDIK